MDFWTQMCIKWLRTEPCVRAWSHASGTTGGRDGSPHAGILLRARDRPRAAGDSRARDRVPGRDRQQLRDLEGLRQSLLAGCGVGYQPPKDRPPLTLMV